MRISTRGRYALRLMLDLATNYTGKPIRLKDVAKRQEISDKYLEQIISILNKAGFVRSVRGPQGGYALQQTPDKYTVGMILRLTEGSLSLWNVWTTTEPSVNVRRTVLLRSSGKSWTMLSKVWWII